MTLAFLLSRLHSDCVAAAPLGRPASMATALSRLWSDDSFSRLLGLKGANALYILASFVEDKVSIGSWIYLWAFYSVPLIYVSVFVPVLYCLDDCGFVVESEVRQADSSSSILLSQDYFGYSRFFVFPYKL